MLIPIKDRIIIAALPDPDTWYGSSLIHRPESTKDRSDQGIIKSVGPEVKYLRVGDFVVFSPYSGMVLNDADEGDRLIMLTEDAIIAVVTDPVTKIEPLYVRTVQDGKEEYHPATAEATILLMRNAYHKIPRVIQMTNKFEDRNK